MKLKDTQDILNDLVLNNPLVRRAVISALSKLRENNAKVIPGAHDALDVLSKKNSTLFSALKVIPENPVLVDNIEDFKLMKSEYIDLIKDTAAMQLKIKFLIKLLQSKESGST